MRVERASVKGFLLRRYFFVVSLISYAHNVRTMPKKKQKRKALNLTPTPRLRAFLEAFVEENDRASVTSVIEEALREFFRERGHEVDAPPEAVLRRILAKQKRDGSEETLEP